MYIEYLYLWILLFFHLFATLNRQKYTQSLHAAYQQYIFHHITMYWILNHNGPLLNIEQLLHVKKKKYGSLYFLFEPSTFFDFCSICSIVFSHLISAVSFQYPIQKKFVPFHVFFTHEDLHNLKQIHSKSSKVLRIQHSTASILKPGSFWNVNTSQPKCRNKQCFCYRILSSKCELQFSYMNFGR